MDTKHIGLQLYAFKLELLLFFFWFFSFSGLLRVDVLQQTSRTKSGGKMVPGCTCVSFVFFTVFRCRPIPLGKDNNQPAKRNNQDLRASSREEMPLLIDLAKELEAGQSSCSWLKVGRFRLRVWSLGMYGPHEPKHNFMCQM